MHYILEFEEYNIKEGLIANKIELWKSKIASTFKAFKTIQVVLGYITGILTLVGLASMGLLYALLYIHIKHPDFVKKCVEKSGQKGMYEQSDQDAIIEVIIDKFYNDEDLQKKIKDAAEHKDAKKAKEIAIKLNSMFNHEEMVFLNDILKNIK